LFKEGKKVLHESLSLTFNPAFSVLLLSADREPKPIR